MSNAPVDLTLIQKRLAQTKGRDYWRGLEEVADTPEFQAYLHREFPRQASEWSPQMSRRGFLHLMGASLALAGVTTACSRPDETIVPYVTAPEETVPGQSLFFATAMTMDGYSSGVLAQSQMNRPTKIEGNPDHPASLGATSPFGQASILTLYDPDRAKEVTQQGSASSWDDFLNELGTAMAQQQASGGAGLRILTPATSSPTLISQLTALLEPLPAARWHQYSPVNRDTVYAGARLAFGQAVEPIYDFTKADVIVSLDADFLHWGPGSVRYARDFADGRRAEVAAGRNRNRLYLFESEPTITGAAADHRLPIKTSQIETVARQLAQALGLNVTSSADSGDASILTLGWIEAIARDLQTNRGTSLIIPGDHQPPSVHALAHAMNEALGNVGQSVTYAEPVLANGIEQAESLRELTSAMAAGTVDLLLILGGNPVYDAPADFDFAAALAKVSFSAHLGLFRNETGAACQWQIPESHYLEAWGDGRAFDGSVTIQQPLIAPLYASRSIHEMVDALLAASQTTTLQADAIHSDHDIVKGYWTTQQGEANMEPFWHQSLHDGIVANTASSSLPVSVDIQAIRQLPTPSHSPGDGLEINFRPDPTIWDGQWANNGWLQELPKPITKLTWENAALISPLTANALGLANGDRVSLAYDGRVIEVPIWLLPGHAVEAITLHLGYGQSEIGRVGQGAGFNAYRLRTSTAPWGGSGVRLAKVGSGYPLASTQLHHSMEGRDLVRVGTVAEFTANPDFVHEMDHHGEEISLYPKFEYPENSWGMTIDLGACIGCNGCMVACQAENNIPIVGKEEVLNGREMHWIRLDRYYEGDLENPTTHYQPVTCMHCENAPCEVVCPVAATLHDSEGLNVMVYNRCVGTRYCSNNCPYKVRRFNFLEYTDYESDSLALQRNPNVTVRARGVMEKCTYCVQRISTARINSKLDGRAIQDGEVVTACQAACPTQAIAFGNLNDPSSQVVQQKASPLNYGLLTELNTHPRTTYLAKLRNPNPALGGEV